MLDRFSKMRHAIVLQHVACETLGTIAEALRTCSIQAQVVKSFQGQRVPSGMESADSLIVMGGPMGVYEVEQFPFLRQEMALIENALNCNKPVLGVCLGSQLLAQVLGARVTKGPVKEIGWFPVRLTPEGARDPLWKDVPSPFTAYVWHGDIFDLPKGSVALALTDSVPLHAFRYGQNAYGLLFHMEVTQKIVEDTLRTFAEEVKAERLDADEILRQAPRHLPALQAISRTVFGRWAKQTSIV